MQVLLIVASLILAANSLERQLVERFMEKMKTIGEECINEVKATADDIESLISHKIPESHEGKCLIFCFHKRFQIQNDDGSVNKEGALKALEPLKERNVKVYNKILQVFKTCNERIAVDSDPCVYSSNLAECAVKEGQEIGLNESVMVELD